jgi:hypothetical protein
VDSLDGLERNKIGTSAYFWTKSLHTLDSNLTNTTKVSTQPISINDLRDREFAGERLSTEEKQALHNYDVYRIQYLNASSSEEEFSKRYLEMQAKANLAPYPEFLKPPYGSHSIK